MQLALAKISADGRHRKNLGDIDALAASILKSGLLHPVVVTKDHRLIAGERRMAAAQKLGWTEIPVTVVETLDDAAALLIAERDENTCRKDFAPSEAVAVGRLLEELERPKAKDRQGRPEMPRSGKLPEQADRGRTREKVATDVGMSGRTYEKAKAVVEAAKAEPERYGDLLKKMDDTGKVSRAHSQLHARRIADKEPPSLPSGTFNLILADPPWSYEFAASESRHLDNQYPTLNVADICAKAPPAAGDAVLFLWATAPQLVEAMEVMRTWGFAYRTNAVWDKEKIGMGFWFRGQHELLLVGVKGKFPPPLENVRVGSVFRERRGGHSTKPESVYAALEKMFPKATRLEMFGRKQRDGWAVWGNQA